MSKKLQYLGILGLAFVLFTFGCKSCGNGRDPLLGKTRVDPPTTNARSVYVERQNANECGVVPGGRPAATVSQEIPSSSDPAGIIQPGAGSVQTVYYPNGLDSTEEPAGVSEKQNSSESSHLRWVSSEVPQKKETRGPSLNALMTSELTEEELANYRYVYDFSVMPPRKVPVGRSADQVSPEKQSAGNAVPQETSDPYVPHSPQLVSNNYDPYAPNRQFERRRAKLSQKMASEFDETDPISGPVQTVKTDTPKNEPVSEAAPILQVQSSSRDSGWRVVASPDPTFSRPAEALCNDSATGTQIAPVQKSVGAKIEVPENPAQRVPGKVQENVRSSEDGALNLFDLPRR